MGGKFMLLKQFLKFNTGPLVIEHAETLITREDRWVEDEEKP